MQQNVALPRVLCLEIPNTYDQDRNQNEVENRVSFGLCVSLLPVNLNCNQTFSLIVFSTSWSMRGWSTPVKKMQEGRWFHSSPLGQEPQGNSYIAAVPWHSWSHGLWQINPSIVDTFCSATSLLPSCDVPSGEFRKAYTLSSLKDSRAGCLWFK